MQQRSGQWWIVLLAAGVIANALVPGAAQAQCGGICIVEVASPQMGSSYAGASASAQDAATAFLNPAGMTRLEKGEILMGSYAAFFNINFDTNQGKTTNPGNPPPPDFAVESAFTNSGGNIGEFLPGIGTYAVMPLAEDLRFGFALNGLFGGSADYDNNWVGRTFITDVELVILNLNPSLAYRVNDWLSLGAGLNVYYAELSKFQLKASTLPGAITLKADGADDWQPSFSVGALLEPREGTRIGINYRYEADLELTGGDASDFEYDFTLPQGFNVGVFHQLTDDLALLFDAGWSDWSEFSQQQILVAGQDISFSRQWDDTWRIGAGFQYQLDESWLWQGGFGFDSSPVNPSKRTPDLPVREQYRLSTGLQSALGENGTIGLSYTLLCFGNPEIHTNEPPTLQVEGETTRTVTAGSQVPLIAVAHDDGAPQARPMPPTRAGLSGNPAPNSGTGFRVSWYVFRGAGEVTFDPIQITEWEDSRDGANGPQAPGWTTPPPPRDNRWVAQATFAEPGTYVLRCQAHDGALPVVQDITFVVNP